MPSLDQKYFSTALDVLRNQNWPFSTFPGKKSFCSATIFFVSKQRHYLGGINLLFGIISLANRNSGSDALGPLLFAQVLGDQVAAH